MSEYNAYDVRDSAEEVQREISRERRERSDEINLQPLPGMSKELIEAYAMQKMCEEADKRRADKYHVPHAESTLQAMIFHILASTSGSIIDRAEKVTEPVGDAPKMRMMADWAPYQSTLQRRLSEDHVFRSLVNHQTKMVMQEVKAFLRGIR